MKKIFKISAAIVVLLLISVYGYLQFRAYRSYQDSIHQEANLIFKVNLDGIFESMSADFISNPAYYLKTDKGEENSRRGISLPANIFVYTLKSKSSGTYFCTLAVTDSTALRQYLKRVFKLKAFQKTADGNMSALSADQKLTVLYNSKRLAMAYSFKKEAVATVLKELLEKKNMMSGAEPELTALKATDGHLTWNLNDYSGSINFKDGAVEVDGTFPIADIAIPGQTGYLDNFTKNATLKVWLNAGIRKFFAHQEFNFRDFHFQADSLLKSYRDYTALELGKSITQKDSVITYEYNDDFEKVAQTTLKEVAVPHIRLTFSANTADLLKYLRKQQVISTSGQLNNKLFPLYQVFSFEQNQAWQLSTLENERFSGGFKPAPYFFFAEADVNRLKSQQQFPLLNPYLSALSYAKFTATKIDIQKGRLQGRIDFHRKNINSFSQLIK